MSSVLIQELIFLATAIFTAGGIVYGARKDIGQTKIDVNRLGFKTRDEERAAARRYHNICMVIIADVDDKDTRFKIAGMLKED